MNKATLITTINNFITSVVNISKVRNAYLELINIFFSTPVRELFQDAGTTSQTITTSANTNIRYNLVFNKQGNVVYVKGYIANTTSNAIASLSLFTFSNTLYNARTSNDTVFRCVGENNNSIATISASLNQFYLIGTLPANTTVNINGFYLTND